MLVADVGLLVMDFFTVDPLVFGSGTRLFVTDTALVTGPKVSVYPASEAEPNGKTTLLCVARDMFPDIVRFTWKMEKNGDKVHVPERDREVLEQKDNRQMTSMMIIDKQQADQNKYICSVAHEADVNAQILDVPKVVHPGGPVTIAAPDCPATTYTPAYTEINHVDNTSFERIRSLYLACLTYTLMILKSLVLSFCAVCVLLQKNSAGKRRK